MEKLCLNYLMTFGIILIFKLNVTSQLEQVGERYVTVITKLIPQNELAKSHSFPLVSRVPPTPSTSVKVQSEARKAQIITDSIPKINFQLNQSSSWHIQATCIGSSLSSFSAIQCESLQDCKKYIPCFDRNKNSICPRKTIIERGRNCSDVAMESRDCLSIDDRRWHLTSGLIECSSGLKNDPKSKFQRTIQHFFKGTDHFFHLVESEDFQISLRVKEEMLDTLEYVGTPVFYTNQKHFVHCRASKFLFKAIKISAIRMDGSTYVIEPDLRSSDHQENKYWQQFYLEAVKKDFNISKSQNLAEIICGAQRKDSGEWIEKAFRFEISDPTVPVIDKSIVMRTNEMAGSLGCSYTGGPAIVQLIREADGRNVIEDSVKSDGLNRVQNSILKEFQHGNFTCMVANSMGFDSFSFHQELLQSSANHVGSNRAYFWVVGVVVLLQHFLLGQN